MPWTKVAKGLWIGRFYPDSDDWCVIVKRADHVGGRRRVYRVGPDLHAAEELAADISKDFATASSARASVAAILGQFEREHVSTLRRRTELLYSSLIDNHLISHFGEKRASTLRKRDFFEYGAARLDGLHSEALYKRFPLVKNSLSVLRSGLNWYWNEHEIDSACPARWIAEQTRRIRMRYEIPERRKAAYTAEELVILLEIARRRFPVLFHMWALDAATGLRIGELLGLEWERIDWLGSNVFPQFQIDDRGMPVLPKSERDPERDGPVRLAPEALEILKARRLVRTSDRWVFATKNGTPYRPRNVQRWIQEVRKDAVEKGVPMSKSFHSTRHTFASGAIAAGWDWESVRAALAHHSAAFTAKVYVHGTGQEHSLDWATAPVKVVMDRSLRSEDTLLGVDDVPSNLLSELENLARPARLERATPSSAREDEPEEDQ